MSQNLPWKRGVLEGGVIVVSVLLALAADAWWDNRQAAQIEASVFAAVAEEVSQNRSVLEADRQAIADMLRGIELFLQSAPATLARLPQDSVAVLVGALGAPRTFDPRSDAALLLSQTALLSPAGVEVRSLVSRWLNQVADAEEEKVRFRDRTNRIQELLAPYMARTTGEPLGLTAQRLASLGPTVLAELRSDTALVEAVILRSTIQSVYLANLETLQQSLESLEAALSHL